MSDPDRIKRLEIFLYILLIIQILGLIGMFLIIQQVNNAVIEIKQFCWGDKVGDIPSGDQPYLNIIH